MPAIATEPSADAGGSEAALRRYAGTRVLLVEDVEMNREVAELLLQETGLVVDTAENGLEAVDKAAANDYDPDPDGRADAGHGRPRGHAGHPRPAGPARPRFWR
jgi:hypothetical protein